MTPVDLFKVLLRPGVTEISLVSDQIPNIKMDGAVQPISKVPWSRDLVLAVLKAAGAANHLENLAVAPAQWTAEIPTVGPLLAAAAQAPDGRLMARFTLAKKEATQAAAPEAPASVARPVTQINRPAPAPAAEPAAPPAPQPRPTVAEAAPKAAAPRPQPNLRVAGGGVSAFLKGALDARASDLHLIAGRPPLARIAGDLTPIGDVLEPDRLEAIVDPIVPERLKPELQKDGAVDFAYQDPTLGRFRVNVNRQRTGLKACFRMIPAEIPTLESLGLPADIGKATHHHQGLIVIAGPTGHGKTSTLAAIVNIINSETSHHVITVEDPVEYVHPRKKAMMSQREVGAHTKSFMAALKGSLREDPDVIVIGELRDTETVRIALTASETGHLVIGTMNTPSAAKTIDRLIDLFPPSDQQQVRMTLAGGLRLVVSQRLLPRADGSSMVAAAEVLPGLVPLWNLIREQKTYQIPSLQQRGKALGIVRLDDSLGALVKAGTVTMEAAMAVADSADELQAIVTGKRVQKQSTVAGEEQRVEGAPPEDVAKGPDTLSGTAKSLLGGFLGKKKEG